MTPSQSPLPFLGTWKLAKCETSRPDFPHPTSGITTFAQEEDGIRYTNESVWSDGRIAKVDFIFKLDGTWSPVTGSLLGDSASCRRLDDGSLGAKIRKGGVDVGSLHGTTSADGRTMTTDWELTGPGGAGFSMTTTQDRQ